jgi:hypothetical protein
MGWISNTHISQTWDEWDESDVIVLVRTWVGLATLTTSTCSRIVMCTVSNSVRNTMLAVAYNRYGNTYCDAVGGYNYNSDTAYGSKYGDAFAAPGLLEV